MEPNRRNFLRLAGTAGIGVVGSGWGRYAARAGAASSAANTVTLDYAVAKLEDGDTLRIPFWRIESGVAGPSLLALAAQHGNEVQGVEVVRRLKEVCARQLIAGSVWLVPMANLPAIRVRRHSVDLGPEQPNKFSKGHNMQQAWPGNPEGNDTERLAYALDRAVVRHCSHAVDIHCWNHFLAAETLVTRGHAPSELLSSATTTRFINYLPVSPPLDKASSLYDLMHRRGGAGIVIEFSGQYQMQERQVQLGLTCMMNIAKALGLLAGEPEPLEGPRVERTPAKTHTVLAPCSGVFMTALKKGTTEQLIPADFVQQGQPLGHILRESDLETVPVVAPVSGYLWQLSACHGNVCDASLPAQHPYTERAETLALIVTR